MRLVGASQALFVGVPSGAAVATAIVLGVSALLSGQPYDSTVGPAAAPVQSGASAPPTAAATTAPGLFAGPGTGSVVFAGAEEVRATVTLPAGWEAQDAFVLKSGSEPAFGVAFFDVAGIYADGCRWELVQPPVGPTVDDLVAAYARLPGFGGPVRGVQVDGFAGKQFEYTVPDYDETECREEKFGIFQEDGRPGQGAAPNLWAQAPKQRNELRVLDVNGTRLVILSGHPSSVSTQGPQRPHHDPQLGPDRLNVPAGRPATITVNSDARRWGGRVRRRHTPPVRVIARLQGEGADLSSMLITRWR